MLQTIISEPDKYWVLSALGLLILAENIHNNGKSTRSSSC